MYVHRYDLIPDSRSSRTRYIPMLEPVREFGGEHENLLSFKISLRLRRDIRPDKLKEDYRSVI